MLLETGEIVQRLSAVAVLLEDTDPIPSLGECINPIPGNLMPSSGVHLLQA